MVRSNTFRFDALVAVFISALVIAALQIVTTAPACANPVMKLPGRWAGWGAVTLANGATEKVKCVATYFVKEKGASVRQNLRCASATYKIDTVADYIIKGGAVSGSWQERTHNNTGKVSGKVTAKGFSLAVSAETFSATLSLTTGKCNQSISLVPINLDIQRISIGLRKC